MAMKLSELAKKLNCDFVGEDCLIQNVADINHAKEGELAFISNVKYQTSLKTTNASAVISRQEWLQDTPVSAVIANDPRLEFAKAATLLNPVTLPVSGVDATAVVATDATISDSATIDANVVIKSGVHIGDNSVIGAGTVLNENVQIGDNSYLHANVTVYRDCHIGDNCILHSGSIIGADGFGFVKDGDAYFKVPQLGAVKIADHVEIGANTCIDRGALDDTIIGEGVKLDNHIQIAHNVEIGEHTVISACSCIAGTVKIGKFCLFGGNVGIRDNIEIVDNVMITARTFVTSSILKSGSYSSSTPMDETVNWRRNAARFRSLDKMARRLNELEKRLDEKGASK